MVRAGQLHAVVEDVHRAVEALVDLHRQARRAVAVRARRQIDDQLAELDGVVVADHTPVLEAEGLVVGALLRPGHVGGLRIRGSDAKAAIVAGKKALQRQVGLLTGGCSGEAKFAAEAVLERAPEAFHPALRLGSGRG